MFCLYTLPLARPAQAKIQMLITLWRDIRSNLLSLIKFSWLYCPVIYWRLDYVISLRLSRFQIRLQNCADQYICEIKTELTLLCFSSRRAQDWDLRHSLKGRRRKVQFWKLQKNDIHFKQQLQVNGSREAFTFKRLGFFRGRIFFSPCEGK